MTDFCCLLNSTRADLLPLTLPSNSHSTLHFQLSQVSALFVVCCFHNVRRNICFLLFGEMSTRRRKRQRWWWRITKTCQLPWYLSETAEEKQPRVGCRWRRWRASFAPPTNKSQLAAARKNMTKKRLKFSSSRARSLPSLRTFLTSILKSWVSLSLFVCAKSQGVVLGMRWVRRRAKKLNFSRTRRNDDDNWKSSSDNGFWAEQK